MPTIRNQLGSFTTGTGPIVGAAIHDGHALRAELQPFMAIPEARRLREEDPLTGRWTLAAHHQIIVAISRFEVDLNRPREGAIYRQPEDAWGLRVWRTPPPPAMMERSLAKYDAFYAHVFSMLRRLERRYGRFVVLDLHSYNHRRDGPGAPPAEACNNPDINVGTGSMPRERWSGLVDRFLDDLRRFPYFGRRLDVRENVRFQGGHFPRWIHERFPESGCALAVEVKKFFMNEWTGEVDEQQVEAIGRAIHSTLPGVLEEIFVWA